MGMRLSYQARWIVSPVPTTCGMSSKPAQRAGQRTQRKGNNRSDRQIGNRASHASKADSDFTHR